MSGKVPPTRLVVEPKGVEIVVLSSRRSSTSGFGRFPFITGLSSYIPGTPMGPTANPTPTSNSFPHPGFSQSSPIYTPSGTSLYAPSYTVSIPSSYNDTRVRYTAPSEIQCLAPLNGNLMSDHVVVAGKTLLQILLVGNHEIKVEWDLLASNSARHNQKLGSISDVCAGHDAMSRMVATASTTGSIFIYDYSAKQPLKLQHHLSNHTRAVNSIDFLTHNPYSILSGSQDGTMKVWDLRIKSSKPTTTIVGNAEAVRCVKFLPHSPRKLVSIFDLGVIKKWDMRMPGQYEKKLNAHTGPGLSVGYHPELDYVVSGGRDKLIQVWNMGSQGNERTPEHVFNTTSPVSGVSWGPLVRNVAPTLFNNNIASLHMNDVHEVVIWNLKRKYIPQRVIQCHTKQVTGFYYKSERQFWSCSRDHSVVQSDLDRVTHPLSDLSGTAMAWGTGFGDLITIDQKKAEFDRVARSRDQSPMNAMVLMGSLSLSPTAFSSGLHQLAPERPILARSTTGFTHPRERPPLPRSTSRVSANGQQEVLAGPSPYAVPVSVPLPQNDDSVFQYLSGAYLVEVPAGMDLAAVCVYHATVAAAALRFRESQTWTMIATALQLDPGFTVERSQRVGGGETPAEVRHSTPPAEEPPISDMEFGSYISPSSRFGSLAEPLSVPQNSGRASPRLPLDTPAETRDLSLYGSMAETRGLVQGFSVPLKEAVGAGPVEQSPPTGITDTVPEYFVLPDSPAVPTLTAHSSVIPTLNVDTTLKGSLHNLSEKNLSHLQSLHASGVAPVTGGGHSHTDAPSFFPDGGNPVLGLAEVLANSSLGPSEPPAALTGHPTKADLLLYPESDLVYSSSFDSRVEHSPFPLAAETKGAGLSKWTSIKSELTRQLQLGTASTHTREPEESKLDVRQVPWAAQRLVEKAAEYAAEQGNVVMCATLTLLFYDETRPLVEKAQALEWIHLYIQILNRKGLFTTAIAIVKNCAFEEIRLMGQAETALRTFCPHCLDLVVNERTKKRHLESKESGDEGFWWCDKCRKCLGMCIYCNEPVKGMALAFLRCGHMGHFGCLREWFLWDENTECPGGCGDHVLGEGS